MLSFEEERIGEIDVRRKVYVPAVGGYARYLEVVSNPSETEQTVALKVFGNLGTDAETAISATSSGDQVIAANDSYFVIDDACANCGVDAVAHVISGELAPQVASDVTLLSDDYAISYNLVIPPGERRIVMHYAVQRHVAAEAVTMAEQLYKLDYPVDGLTIQELRDIVNFKYLVDSDRDGVFDVDEFMRGMDLASNDSDGDLLADLFEFRYGLNPLSLFGEGEALIDSDLDGLTNLEEQGNNTNPTLPDTDGDGLSDGDELNTHLTSPVLADSDGDGWDDYEEINTHGSDPLVANVDENMNGVPDAVESVQPPADVTGPVIILRTPMEGALLTAGQPVQFQVVLIDDSQISSAYGVFNSEDRLSLDAFGSLVGDVVPFFSPLVFDVSATDEFGNTTVRQYIFEVLEPVM
jgi:hypothetical protein